MKKESSGSVGLGLCEVLTVVFIVLKLCGVISWSWWWILSPLWIGFIIGVLILAGVIIYYVLDARKYKKKGKGKWKF